jgi:hypothetical protein
MQQCKLENPLETIRVLGHCWRRNHKLRADWNLDMSRKPGEFYWDGEWFCEWCNEVTEEDPRKFLRP